MRKKLKEIADAKVDMQMTSFMDVTFLLIIFFICTLKFKTLEGKLAAYLPKDVGVNNTQAEPIPKVEVTLRVLQAGTKYDPRGEAFGVWKGVPGSRFKYGSDRVIEYQIGPQKKRDLSEVAQRLKTIHLEDPTRPATIDARPGIVYADVVKVLDAALLADFTEVTFVGSYE
jgi:biopolymer transport protein ExbD